MVETENRQRNLNLSLNFISAQVKFSRCKVWWRIRREASLLVYSNWPPFDYCRRSGAVRSVRRLFMCWRPWLQRAYKVILKLKFYIYTIDI